MYTLWSRGRLLGHTDLGFVPIKPTLRTGWFHPSPLGDTLMPVLTGTGPALRAVGKLMSDPVLKARRGREGQAGEEWPPDIRMTTEYADLVSSVDELESMQLQLRDSGGAIVTTTHIGIDDTQFKLSFLSRRQRRRRRRLWTLVARATSGERFPRYQIQVHLSAGEGSAPGAEAG